MLVPILKWVGVEESHSYGTADIRGFLTKVFLMLGLVGTLLHFLMNKLLKIQLKISRWWGLGVIFGFFIFSVVSCFSPTAMAGSQSTVPVLVFFLLFSFFSYVRYLLFQFLGKWLPTKLLHR
ncbi:hypothetical protein GYA27_04775 [candidate division WWE3 bacterium]|uniref:Uncharacterized protein n=1 Tax=candidate division WWE3 bacterium TaxID=2053526 RepID=A0A7X9DLI5_UNCKA|nr:hypothetical protein [candidate division WWE3 bacterium]